MPVVFVHGVPDTWRVWRALIGRLHRADVVTLSLPGFGCEVPAGFDCSKEAYCDWLMREVDNVDGPVDLVAHDWGAILALRVASLEPTLLRTWAVGGAPLDPEYEWHKVAKLWQTPEVGEQVMEKVTPETLAAGLVAAGVPAADATEAARHVDATMKRSILALYRSGVRVGAEWEHGLARVGARGVVPGPGGAAIRQALSDLPVRFAVNPRPQDGQGTSIAVGVGALKPWTRAAMIALGDQPRIPDAVVRALLEAFQRAGKPIAAPAYRGVQGTPVVFSSEVFAELRALGGDRGARAVVAAHPERVELVAIDSAMPPDVDTPEDYAKLHVQ